MGMPVKIVNADTTLENIEQHVKVFAGPGAGKTRWLINHIKRVLHSSKRLQCKPTVKYIFLLSR